ncbi:S8 family serine peptidase [Myroides sp. M-43]|uniref:S8 family serine peptidase n=1 Tax=Myroides oncorhynchi TaxID=2893756 RepID=UPI001E4B61FC|nr:S8 family serine peptidase [Myroides oncorhynchi]MCC9043193.1 S8 family serine peptidase [Myroides oncorhynchi]
MNRIIVTSFILLIYGSLLGQNSLLREEISKKHDLIEGNKLVEVLENELVIDSKNVNRYQQEYSINKSGSYKDGRVFQLRRIDNGNLPIFYSTQNALTRKILEVDDLEKGGDLRVDLQGKDMIIGIWDGQAVFDKHREFIKENRSRVLLRDHSISIHALWGLELLDAEKAKSHATHVAGTLIAKGVNLNSKGLAPEATIWSYDWNNDIVEMANAAQEGLLVSNHSYGISAIDDELKPLLPISYFGYYNKDAYQMDQLTYTFPYYQPVVSAGNDREFFSIINPSKKENDLLLGNANSKNAVVVAAVGLNDYGKLEIAKFSSYGPTSDFRIKPDIAAPGVKVISTAYELSRNNTNDATDIYKASSGTSMAAPAVSAILTLWQQGYIETFGFPMRSASLRALLSHTALYIEEQKPNQKTGWGVVNAHRGISLLQNIKKDVAILKESVLLEKKEYEYKFNLDQYTKKLLVTLSWTDPEGDYNKFSSSSGLNVKKLVNDLDVRVFKDGVEYKPWYLTKDYSYLTAFKGDNDVDVIERVEIDDAESGEYVVIVNHKGNLRYGRQDFSLIISDDNLKGIEKAINAKSVEPDSILVWPNPVENVVNIEVTKDKVFHISDLEVFDLSNRLVKKVKFGSTNRAVIDMTDLSKGVYLLNINVGGENIRTKLIKK